MQTLCLIVNEPLPFALLSPFQGGAEVEVKVGGNLLSLLTEDLGLSEEAIARIQTVFWRSKPVDDIAGCVISDGGVLTLSAALPGLVGAVLRRDGYWAAMRDSITHQNDGSAQHTGRGIITIKLFNFMLSEVGPLLLKRGIRLGAAELTAILNDSSFIDQLVGARLAGREIAIDKLGGLLFGEEKIMLCIETVSVIGTD